MKRPVVQALNLPFAPECLETIPLSSCTDFYQTGSIKKHLKTPQQAKIQTLVLKFSVLNYVLHLGYILDSEVKSLERKRDHETERERVRERERERGRERERERKYVRKERKRG